MIAAIERHIALFFRWWFAELAATIPAALRDRLLQPEDQIHIHLGRDGASAFVAGGKRDGEALAIRPGVDPATAGTEIAESLRRHRIATRGAIVELASGSVLETIFDVPIEASDSLPDVLSAEIERRTPFSADEVHFSFRVLDADDQLETLKIRLQVTPRAEVDKAIVLANAAGLSLIEVRAGAPYDTEPMNLLPSVVASGRKSSSSRLTLVMLVAVAALGAAAVYIPVEQMHRTTEIVDKRIADLEDANAQLTAASDVYAELVGIRQKLSGKKEADVSAIGLLSEVTRLMPDHSWLVQMQMNGERITLSGFTRNPTDLVRALESSVRFSDVHFSAPVTREEARGIDRFHITLTAPRGAGA